MSYLQAELMKKGDGGTASAVADIPIYLAFFDMGE
jgi:hypothetical protein